MAHPHLLPPFPIYLILWATFPWLPMLVTTCAGETAELACPCPFSPLLLSTAHMISFRHFLSALFSKAYQWLHQRRMTRMSILPPCSISFYSHTFPCPVYSLFHKCMAMSWDIGFLFCVRRGSKGTFLDKDSLMIHWYHNYKKFIFTLKLLLSVNIFSLSVQFLAKLYVRPSESYKFI